MPLYNVHITARDEDDNRTYHLFQLYARKVRLADWPDMQFLVHKDIVDGPTATTGEDYSLSEYLTGTNIVRGCYSARDAMELAARKLKAHRDEVPAVLARRLGTYGYANPKEEKC